MSRMRQTTGTKRCLNDDRVLPEQNYLHLNLQTSSPCRDCTRGMLQELTLEGYLHRQILNWRATDQVVSQQRAGKPGRKAVCPPWCRVSITAT